MPSLDVRNPGDGGSRIAYTDVQPRYSFTPFTGSQTLMLEPGMYQIGVSQSDPGNPTGFTITDPNSNAETFKAAAAVFVYRAGSYPPGGPMTPSAFTLAPLGGGAGIASIRVGAINKADYVPSVPQLPGAQDGGFGSVQSGP